VSEERALTKQDDAAVIEAVIVKGDLSQLTPKERVQYYRAVCESLALNPLTKPFEYIELNGKLVLYALRGCTDQLRDNRHVNITMPARELVEGVYIVTARATMPNGRTDESVGAVALERENGEWKTAESGKRYFARNGTYTPLRGEDRANAIMKAETKAKRRVTLSIVGLGWLDESEVGTVPGAQQVRVTEAGEIVAQAAPPTTEPPAEKVKHHWPPSEQNRYAAELRKRTLGQRQAADLLGLQKVALKADLWELGSVDEVLAVIDAAIECQAEAEQTTQQAPLPEPEPRPF